jgi:hypothetical protein
MQRTISPKFLFLPFLNDAEFLCQMTPNHPPLPSPHRYLMSRLSLQVVYLWRHVSSTVPPFILWWSNLEILFGPFHRRSPFIRGLRCQAIQMEHGPYSIENPKSSLYCDMSMLSPIPTLAHSQLYLNITNVLLVNWPSYFNGHTQHSVTQFSTRSFFVNRLFDCFHIYAQLLGFSLSYF